MNHESVEKNIGLMGVLIALVIPSAPGQIVPLYFQGVGTDPAPGVRPYPALTSPAARVLRRAATPATRR